MTLPSPVAAPQAIPVPPEFPVSLDPREEGLLWEHDRVHFPNQLTVLEAELLSACIGKGMTHAMRRYEAPIDAMQVRIEHGYAYSAMVPVIAPPEMMEELGRRSQAQLLPAIAGIRRLWEHEWLPEIVRHLDAMQSVDLRIATVPALLAHLDECISRLTRLWKIHFEIVLPSYLAVSEFEELHNDLFEGSGFDAYRLLQGFPTKTFEIGRDLWRLSRVALDEPEVIAVLDTESAATVPATLARTDAGRAFLAELDAHLAAYGNRAPWWGLALPTFREDPTPLIKIIKDYTGRPENAEPGRELERLAAEREDAVAEARERLAGYPAMVAEQFESMLASAQFALVLTEDHGFYIDGWSLALMRAVIVELGRRLAAGGVIEGADDVQMLTVQEIVTAARHVPIANLHTPVAERRAELERFAAITPPRALGTLPPGPPPESPFTRMAGKFGTVDHAQPADRDVLAGAAGSSGRVTGVARIIGSLDDAVRLEPGDVLVAESTAPPWTPLFAVAAAVVTDTGGILSHCAVVAREYGLPAVVGTGVATEVIRDGDVVEVDGDAGTVRIVR